MPLRFRKRLIAVERFEAGAFVDVDNNGVLDIVSGGWWYEGPDFLSKHRIGPNPAFDDYYDDFSAIALDINGNGLPDIVTGGWFGRALRWLENPGSTKKEWPMHQIAECGSIETTRAWDVDGDGVPELVPNTPRDELVIYKLERNAQGKGTGAFSAHSVYPEAQGHGLGFGDINGDGRGDFVLSDGWLEAPPDPFRGNWIWHPEFDLGAASVPIIVADVNGDGLNDLIAGQSHGYGLSWWQQKMESGRRSWIEHPIDPYNSQYHDMRWLDIDNDGICELVTGKRYMAHCGLDPGAYDDIGVYYFKWAGESFSKQVVDYGPFPEGAGCGIHFDAADTTGNGYPDILAPGKDGLHLLYNLGPR